MVKPGTVLITGGTGFLGSRIVARLLALKYRVIVVRRSQSRIDHLLKIKTNNLSFFDYNGQNLAQCFKKNQIDFVIHTATCYGRDYDRYADVVAANVLLPMQLLELSLEHKVKVFVNTDTFFTNDLGLSPKKKSYTKTKKLFLELATEASEGTALRLVNMRIQQMYGPGDNENKFVMTMGKALLNNVVGLDLTLGQQKRDFIYVDDVAKAFGQVLKHYKKLDCFEEFGLGWGRSISIRKAVSVMKQLAESKTVLRWGALPYRANEIFNAKAVTRANKKINWQPRVSFSQGLILTFKQLKKYVADTK